MRKSILKKCIMLCLIVTLGVTSSISVCYAQTPTIYSDFSELKVGKTDFCEENYDGNQLMAGCFVAPEENIYTVDVVNTGALKMDTCLYDDDFSKINESSYLWSSENHRFGSFHLQKGEKLYFWAGRSYTDDIGMLAARVIITKKSGKAVTISQKALSLNVGKQTTLKLKNNKKSKVIWLSDKKTVATVSGNGVVKAKKRGTAIIYAISNDKLYKCVVTAK